MAYQSFARFALCFLRSGGLALFAQNVYGLLDVAAGFNQRRAAIIETCIGTLAQSLYKLRWYMDWILIWIWLCAHSLLSQFAKFFRIVVGYKSARR